jgi:hypothetical protein
VPAIRIDITAGSQGSFYRLSCRYALFDKARGYSRIDPEGFGRLANDGARTNDASLCDTNTIKYRAVGTNPDIILYHDTLMGGFLFENRLGQIAKTVV